VNRFENMSILPQQEREDGFLMMSVQMIHLWLDKEPHEAKTAAEWNLHDSDAFYAAVTDGFGAGLIMLNRKQLERLAKIHRFASRKIKSSCKPKDS
jgi:hypothetical protein